MNILAQHGFGPGDKLKRGIEEDLISGAILSPRYLTPDNVQDKIEEWNPANARVLMDPEYFATEFLRHPSPNLGNMEKWSYLKTPQRSQLITGSAIPEIIQDALQFQNDMDLQEWIAPNVFIRKADSIDTAIAINFITHTKQAAQTMGDSPVFASIAIHRDAILNDKEFRSVLDAITAVESPPDGYYILVGSSDSGNSYRSDLYDPEVIAGWMYMNYVLSINGVRVINGYCHLLSPLLGIAGAEACAHGWFSTLRKFSIDKYIRERSGGRPPYIRYVSTPLLSYLRQTDYEDFRAVEPAIMTGSSYDSVYETEDPSRTEEVLQSWEALSMLCDNYCTGNIEDDITSFNDHIDNAFDLWATLENAGFSQGIEANKERLEAMRSGIELFKQWAELV